MVSCDMDSRNGRTKLYRLTNRGMMVAEILDACVLAIGEECRGKIV